MQVKGQKPKKTEPMYFHTSLGREIICGKNNTQNDFLSTKLAEKSDWWFHVKGGAGSHVIMRCGPDEDPDARDFTEAAQAAAFFSDRGLPQTSQSIIPLRNLSKSRRARRRVT